MRKYPGRVLRWVAWRLLGTGDWLFPNQECDIAQEQARCWKLRSERAEESLVVTIDWLIQIQTELGFESPEFLRPITEVRSAISSLWIERDQLRQVVNETGEIVSWNALHKANEA